MLKIITNYKKLFIKVLRNDLEGLGGWKIEKLNNNKESKDETVEEKVRDIIAWVKWKLEKLKISVWDFLIWNAVESEKSKLTLEQKNSAKGLKELVKNKTPPLVAWARA